MAINHSGKKVVSIKVFCQVINHFNMLFLQYVQASHL